MSDIFELEQDIIRCWAVTNDIGDLLEDLENAYIDVDTAIQAFRAYQKVYSLRFERCWRNFERISEENRQLRNQAKELQQVVEQQQNLAKFARSKGRKKVDQ